MKKAVENGVIEPNAELSDEEAYKLVFHAGLSTAKQITDISGRGVGMDVVKKNIEALQGRVDIRSEVGKGTVFSICLPLTLAIIDGQIVTVGNERYIVPINSIVNSFRPDPSQISSVQNQGEMVRVRGELMPLIRLYNLFGVREAVSDPQEGLLVIVEADHLRSCILVDDLLWATTGGHQEPGRWFGIGRRCVRWGYYGRRACQFDPGCTGIDRSVTIPLARGNGYGGTYS